jgi:hypothetical protein
VSDQSDGDALAKKLGEGPSKAYDDRTWGQAFKDALNSGYRLRDATDIFNNPTAYVERKGMSALGFHQPGEPEPEPPKPAPEVVTSPGGTFRTPGVAPVESPGGTFMRPPPQVAAVAPAPATAPARPMAGAVQTGPSTLSQYRDAERQEMRTLEEGKELMADQGIDQAGRAEAVSLLRQAEADRQRRMAEDQQATERQAAQRFDAFQAQTERMTNNIATQQPDPGRLLHSASAGMQFSMALGAVAGGMLAGLQGGPNQFLAHLDKIIDRDIDAQKTQVENKRFAVGARNTMLSQMIQQAGDERLGMNMYRQMLLEAAKTDIAAKAESLGIPEIRAQSSLAVNGLQQKIDLLNKQNLGEKLRQEQAAAAAALAAKRAEEERQWQRQKDIFEMNLKAGDQGIKQQNADTERTKAGAKTNQLSEKEEEQLRARRQGLSYLYDLRRMADEGGELSSERTARGKSLFNGALNTLARAETGGTRAPSEVEQEIIAKQLGTHDPNEWVVSRGLGLSNPSRAALDETIRKNEEAVLALEAKIGNKDLPANSPNAGPGVASFTPKGAK